MIWVTNIHQHFVPLICLSEKNVVTDINFLCMPLTSQQDPCGTVPPKSTLNELNKCLYGATGSSWG